MENEIITEHGASPGDAVQEKERLSPNFGRMSIWAYSIGTSIGWVMDS